MKAINNLLITTSLIGTGSALAHGTHAEAPADSLLHLLAHHWPLLVMLVLFLSIIRTMNKAQ